MRKGIFFLILVLSFLTNIVSAANVKEKIPAPWAIKDYISIERRGNALWGLKNDVILDNFNNTLSLNQKISGKTRGTWFFEASFPIEILDANRNNLGIFIAQANGDWMTTDFVNFTSDINLDKSKIKTKNGYLIFKKDNPSGLPENDQSREFSITFNLEQPSICTLEYNPVCGVNNITYGNKCQAGNIKILHKGVCKEKIAGPWDVKNFINIERRGNALWGNKMAQ